MHGPQRINKVSAMLEGVGMGRAEAGCVDSV